MKEPHLSTRAKESSSAGASQGAQPLDLEAIKPMNEQAYFVDTPWTWRERLKYRLFPSAPCPLPDAPAAFKDVLETTTRCEFSIMDRLRILVTGKCVVRTRTVCENIVGDTRTSSAAYPVL